MKNYPYLTIRNLSFGSLIALCLATAGLQTAQAEEHESRGQLSAKDYKFVSEAAKGGMMEVDLGRIAAQKATDPSVRTFAQRMVDDHSKANDELKQLVAQKGAVLPESSTRKEEKMTEHFNRLSGADFDKAYMKAMVKDHKTDVKEFQKASEKSDDVDLKNWAAKTLPTLQEHLQMAESAEAMVKASK